MRDSRRSQKDLLWTCALQQKRDSNTGQLENSGNHLQTIYMYATSCQRVGLVFDLAITCFTQLQEIFLKARIFGFLEKSRLLQSTLLTGISSSRFRGQCHQRRGVLVVKSYAPMHLFRSWSFEQELLERVVCIRLFKWRT